MIDKFKYGQTWKIWSSPLSLSLCSTFKNENENFIVKAPFIVKWFTFFLWLFGHFDKTASLERFG